MKTVNISCNQTQIIYRWATSRYLQTNKFTWVTGGDIDTFDARRIVIRLIHKVTQSIKKDFHNLPDT